MNLETQKDKVNSPKIREALGKEIYNEAKLFWLSQNKSFQDFYLENSTKQKSLSLKELREAQLLSLQTVAKRLKKSRAALSKMEISQAKGTITINHLSEMAEVLGCDLNIEIKPKIPIAESIFKILWEHAKTTPRLSLVPKFKSEAATKTQMAQIIASEATALLNQPQFRKKMGWSKRKCKK